MQATTYSASESGSARGRLFWVGWILSGLLIAFCMMDGAIKLFYPQIVMDASKDLGWPADPAIIYFLGVTLIASTALYALPRTAVLGAILLTGYLGGAIATHVRIGSPLLTHDLFGVYLGLFVWGGLWFRDARIRALIPFRK